jgi:RNA polymerase sigma factor (sigma-70 family)
MSRHFSSESPTFLLPDNLDMQRLHDAQECLRCRERHQIPSSAETQAWEWFHPTYDQLLRHWAPGCHINPDDVNDCLQEVWIEVMNKLPAFDSDGTQAGLCSWLHAIVHAKAVDLLRYQSRHPTKRLGSEAEASLLSQHAGPAAECEHRARQEVVQRVLALLRESVSELTFDAFHRHWVQGHTIKQIAADLTETRRQISCRLNKAKQKFRHLCNQLVQKDLWTEV